MVNPWKPEDHAVIRNVRQRENSFLQDLDETHFAQRAPIISITCPDRLRNWDMVGHIAKLRGFNPGEDHCTHALGWHGGIIRLVPHFPGNSPASAEVFLRELQLAVQVAEIFDNVGQIHWPCGFFMRNNITLHQAFSGLMEAKRIAKKEIPGIKVRTIIHCDYGDLAPREKKSYFAEPERCHAWLDEFTPECV